MTGENSPVQVKPRMLWLDAFRGLAVILMIQTHVMNTFLAKDARASAWFDWLNYVNGLIAPSFLFIAGFAVGLAMRNGRGNAGGVGKKTKRLCGILLLGYALHFPAAEIAQGNWAEAWQIGTRVDVLPCIAVSLALLLGIQWVVRRAGAQGQSRIWNGALAISISAALFGAAALQFWRAGPLPLVAFVNQSSGSLFPVLPWAAFVFAGAWRGSVQGKAWRFSLVWVCMGLGAMWWRGHSEFSAISPAFFFERLAWVLLLMEACRSAAGWESRIWVRMAGRESLLMYAGHLVIISTFAGAGIPQASLSLGQVALMFFAVLVLSFAGTLMKTRGFPAFIRWAAARAIAPAA